MSETNNPYTTPESDVNNNPQSRSAIPKVIGIISIILGALGLIFGLFGLASVIFAPDLMATVTIGFGSNYLMGSTIVSILTSIWAIFIGFKLLKYLDLGRRHFNIYTVVAIIISIVTFLYSNSIMTKMLAEMSPEMASAADKMSTLTPMGAFIAPIILIIVALLLNQKNVKDTLN